MMAICVLMEVACSFGSLHPSNMAKKGEMNPSGIDAPISYLRVLGDLIIQFPPGEWTLVSAV